MYGFWLNKKITKCFPQNLDRYTNTVHCSSFKTSPKHTLASKSNVSSYFSAFFFCFLLSVLLFSFGKTIDSYKCFCCFCIFHTTMQYFDGKTLMRYLLPLDQTLIDFFFFLYFFF